MTKTDTDTPTPALTTWRPPGWVEGRDDPFAPEEGHTPESIEKSYDEFKARGYYTAKGLLTEKGRGAKDSRTAEDVSMNRRRLRDAWNTYPAIWRLASALTGREFKVDPFWNQGACGLPELQRTLDGLTLSTDGLLTVEKARTQIARADELGLLAYEVKTLERYLNHLGEDVDPMFPANWRGDLAPGEADAAANGPHSDTASWLACAFAYSREEFTAAFVPDNGDGWFQNIAMRFSLVVRLGRVPCLPPPGVKSSSPRGASALLIGIPRAVQTELVELDERLSKLRKKDQAERETIVERMDELLPEPTRRVLLRGEAFSVPWRTRARVGAYYAYVQRGMIETVEDFGLLK